MVILYHSKRKLWLPKCMNIYTLELEQPKYQDISSQFKKVSIFFFFFLISDFLLSLLGRHTVSQFSGVIVHHNHLPYLQKCQFLGSTRTSNSVHLEGTQESAFFIVPLDDSDAVLSLESRELNLRSKTPFHILSMSHMATRVIFPKSKQHL